MAKACSSITEFEATLKLTLQYFINSPLKFNGKILDLLIASAHQKHPNNFQLIESISGLSAQIRHEQVVLFRKLLFFPLVYSYNATLAANSLTHSPILTNLLQAVFSTSTSISTSTSTCTNSISTNSTCTNSTSPSIPGLRLSPIDVPSAQEFKPIFHRWLATVPPYLQIYFKSLLTRIEFHATTSAPTSTSASAVMTESSSSSSQATLQSLLTQLMSSASILSKPRLHDTNYFSEYIGAVPNAATLISFVCESVVYGKKLNDSDLLHLIAQSRKHNCLKLAYSIVQFYMKAELFHPNSKAPSALLDAYSHNYNAADQIDFFYLVSLMHRYGLSPNEKGYRGIMRFIGNMEAVSRFLPQNPYFLVSNSPSEAIMTTWHHLVDDYKRPTRATMAVFIDTLRKIKHLQLDDILQSIIVYAGKTSPNLVIFNKTIAPVFTWRVYAAVIKACRSETKSIEYFRALLKCSSQLPQNSKKEKQAFFSCCFQILLKFGSSFKTLKVLECPNLYFELVKDDITRAHKINQVKQIINSYSRFHSHREYLKVLHAINQWTVKK